MTTDRTLPFDNEIEQALLGSVLVDNYALRQVSDVLAPEDFWDPLHQRLCRAIQKDFELGRPVSPLTLSAALADDPGFEEVGGLRYLTSLARAAPALPNVGEYARILRELRSRRSIITLGEDMVNAAFPGDAPPALEMIREAEVALSDISRGVYFKKIATPGDTAQEIVDEIESVIAGRQIFSSVPYGIEALDRRLGGMRAGHLLIVAGRPGMAKSTWLGEISLNTARLGYPSIVFSLEMPRHDWVERLITSIDFDIRGQGDGPLQYERIGSRRVRDKEFDRVVRATQELMGISMLEIVDEAGLSMDEISARARAFSARHHGKIGAAYIDYLQKVRPSGKRGMSREQEVAEIADGHKHLARRLRWPVMAGAQVGRAVESRPEKDRRPTLADLRESGAIEQEADIVFFPYRAAYYIKNREPKGGPNNPEWAAWNAEYEGCVHTLEAICAKRRGGREFAVDLWCEIGSSVVKSHEPTLPRAQVVRDGDFDF